MEGFSLPENFVEKMREQLGEELDVKKVGNQVCVCYEDGSRKYFHSNLKIFTSKFPKSRFQKINRSVVVNVDKVTGVIKNRVIIANTANFEVSRSFRKAFIDRLPM